VSDVVLRDVYKAFGVLPILHGISLSVQSGEFVVFVGPSGCGKSTLLRVVAGLETFQSGIVELDGADVSRVPAGKRNIAMVFQNYALYPHMSVRDNIGFGLRMNHMPRAEVDRRVAEASQVLQLEKLLGRKPSQLSGGQRQRVAMARALVRQPKIFLFDEPLSNLDAKLRVEMRAEIRRLHSEFNATMIYVTHDQVEAMTMADRIVVLNHGRVEQIGTPVEVYDIPSTVFVAGFIGSPAMNLVSITSSVLQGGPPISPLAALATSGDKITVGVRPEHLLVGHAAPGGVMATIEAVEVLGAETLLTLLVGTDRFTARVSRNLPVKRGERIPLAMDPAHLHCFDAEGRRLPL
jgi:ABC-type sugar transport system ATPase subunit